MECPTHINSKSPFLILRDAQYNSLFLMHFKLKFSLNAILLHASFIARWNDEHGGKSTLAYYCGNYGKDEFAKLYIVVVRNYFFLYTSIVFVQKRNC